MVEKDYFTLDEVIEGWRIPHRDLVYLAENGLLRLSARVFGVCLERGGVEQTPEGEPFTVPYERARFSGLVDLSERDVHQVFRAGETQVRAFHVDDGYCHVVEPSDPVSLRREDLLVRQEERTKVERHILKADRETPPTWDVMQTNDYQQVSFSGLQFHFGPIQASVVRILDSAARDGSPWRHGKLVLAEAGSASVRMADIFKSQPDWRRLILSDGRGRYRLAAQGDGPAGSAISKAC
ncbi:MAG: hypothetical protein Q8M31_16905 [Beijerinckiaceae bacterium]|nr:hypothetical protein [Beijerinckiaceae bacterium]